MGKTAYENPKAERLNGTIKNDYLIPYHPISLYSMLIEHNPNTLLLMRSFIVSLLDKVEKAIPSLTPENLVDPYPIMRPLKL